MSRTADELDEVDELWTAVTEPTRRRLVDALLVRGEATATTLAGELPVSRQAISKHLAVLHRVGLVQSGRYGREVRYALRPERMDVATRLMARVAKEWDDRLGAIKHIAEAVERDRANQVLKEASEERSLD